MPLEKLRQVINAIHPLGNAEWDDFSQIWKPFSARRKITLTAPGETENYLYFVLEGVQRVYYLDEQGREATLVFSYAPSFGGVVDSFMLQQKSGYYYETLTTLCFSPCRVWRSAGSYAAASGGRNNDSPRTGRGAIRSTGTACGIAMLLVCRKIQKAAHPKSAYFAGSSAQIPRQLHRR